VFESVVLLPVSLGMQLQESSLIVLTVFLRFDDNFSKMCKKENVHTFFVLCFSTWAVFKTDHENRAGG